MLGFLGFFDNAIAPRIEHGFGEHLQRLCACFVQSRKAHAHAFVDVDIKVRKEKRRIAQAVNVLAHFFGSNGLRAGRLYRCALERGLHASAFRHEAQRLADMGHDVHARGKARLQIVIVECHGASRTRNTRSPLPTRPSISK